MKSERRHQLQENALAGQVEKILVEVRPYATLILGAFAAVIVVALGWAIYSGTQLADRQQSWSQYQDALAAEQDEQLDQLLRVAQQHPDTKAGYWALQTAADVQANQAAALMFTEKEEAEELLLAARNNYQKVTSASKTDELLSQRARLGLAKVEESLYGLTGDAEYLDSATQTYEMISKSWPETGVAEVADDRLRFLAMSDSKEFYQWLAEYKPTPPPAGQDGGGQFNPFGPPQGTGPGNERRGLELPNELQLPDVDLGLNPPTTESPAESPVDLNLPESTERPAEPAESTTEEPPAEVPDSETPEANTPAGDASETNTPATDTPAEPAESGNESPEVEADEE